MNCDLIALFYERIERAAFGNRLQEHRLAYLHAAKGKQRALILGDGDGRFTRDLMNAYPELAIESIELSSKMIEQARRRHAIVRQGDARSYPFELASYDVIFTHFFLDCFTTSEVDALVSRLSAALKKDAIWIVSDFRQATTGWRKLFTRVWLSTMYLFFRLTTGLQTQVLPSYGKALEQAGFIKVREQVSMAGLIASEWWQRSNDTRTV